MTTVATFDRLKTIIANHMNCPAASITPETTKTDLGMDRLDEIEIIIEAEEEFGFEIADAEADACNTVQDLVNLIDRHRG
jgi:acyl carrier protein